MMISSEGRWPPVYDAAGLRRMIEDLVNDEAFSVRFWELVLRDGVCQGDVVHLDSTVPVLDDTGQPALTDSCKHWLVLGNTCDFSRDAEDVEWTHFAPLVDVGVEPRRELLQAYRTYRYSRQFYVPPWPGGDYSHRVADFTRPVTVHKRAFTDAARVVARMQFPAWVLLNSCLVRYLARDDGRHDPG